MILFQVVMDWSQGIRKSEPIISYLNSCVRLSISLFATSVLADSLMENLVLSGLRYRPIGIGS